MQVGTVQKLITIFSESFQKLGQDVPLVKLEDLAVTIHRAMTVHARHFHTLEHVFTFVDGADPIRTLAALYHDIVYFQVDMGFSPQIWQLISAYITQNNGEFFVSAEISKDDRLAAMMLDIFELVPGQKLSSVAALNEFLSALVMVKQLSGIVSEKDMLQMALCIEATIPFRPKNAEGLNHFENMEKRLPVILAKYGLELSEAELIRIIGVSVIFANKDIENFAEADPGQFLDNTWKLLPETNAALRLPDVYSIGTYRLALQRMFAFFNFLDPDCVFNQYRGNPSDEEFKQMTKYARNNIVVAREYLQIKILSMVVLEALAIATGGDAPVSLFMGDVPREGVSIKRLEYFLPEMSTPHWVDNGSTIYQLLESGRASDTSFDMRNSPLSLFIYKSTPPEKIVEYLQFAEEMFTGNLSAHDFLMKLDKSIVAPIAQASSIMVYTRRNALMQYAGL